MSENSDIARQRLPPRAGARHDDAPRRLAPASVDLEGLDVRDILGALRRRLPVIVASVVFITAVAAAYISEIVPRYSAEAWVMLDTRHAHVGIEDMVPGLEVDSAVVRSEMELIRSYPLSEKVAKELQLEKEPEFNPSLRHLGFADYVRHPLGFLFSWLRRVVLGPRPSTRRPESRGVIVALPLGTAKRGAAGKPEDAPPPSDIVWSLLGHVSVSTNGRSYLLRIHADSESPELAAKIANAYANTYLLNQLQLKYDEVRRTSAWLNEHLTELRDKLRDSENAVELFREQHNITQTLGGTVTAQQLTELNTQLVATAGERAQKEAGLRTLQEQIKDGAAPSGAALSSPLLQKLREQEAELMQRQAELATRYKPEHPTMVNLRAEIQDVTRKIKQETDKAMAQLVSDVAVARAREAALRTTLNGLQHSTDQQDQASIEARELEREAQANKVLYESFLSKFKQTNAQEDIQQADARLVASAIPPTGPSYPDKPKLVSMSVIGALFVGLVLAFVLERLDNGFRGGEQVEKALGLRALGLVPDVRGKGVPHNLVVEEPKALYSEAVRAVRTALRYTNVDRPPKVVLVTSSLPGEGKTVLALSLARSVARSGGKALIIDCDLRRPGIARLSGCGTERSIVDLFDGAEPETLVTRDSESGIDIIPAKVGTANPQDALGSQRMKTLLDAMRPRYDLVVVDAPPVLVVSDPIVLSHLVDATLFVIRWEDSARKSVAQGLRLLQADGATLAGAVVTRVHPRRHKRYGYGDSVRYHYYGDYAEPDVSAGV